MPGVHRGQRRQQTPGPGDTDDCDCHVGAGDQA